MAGLCHVLPDPSAYNRADQRLSYPVPFRQDDAAELSAMRFEHRPDLNDLCLGQLRRRVSLACAVGPVELLVGLVLGRRAIGKIADATVGFVAIQVAANVAVRDRPYEVNGDQAVDQEALGNLSVPKLYFRGYSDIRV